MKVNREWTGNEAEKAILRLGRLQSSVLLKADLCCGVSGIQVIGRITLTY